MALFALGLASLIGIPYFVFIALIQSIWFWLAAAIVFYWWRMQTRTPPFGPGDMLMWFSGLTDDQQSTISAVVLGSVAILGALCTNYYSWRRQKRIEIMLQLSEEISNFFRDCHDNGIRLHSTLYWLLDYKDKVVDGSATPQDAELYSVLINKDAASFDSAILAIREADRLLPSLRARASTILAHLECGLSSFEVSAKEIDTLESLTWIPMPSRPLTPEALQSYVTKHTCVQHRELKAYLDNDLHKMLAGSGAIAGGATRPLYPVNVRSILNFRRTASGVAEQLTD